MTLSPENDASEKYALTVSSGTIIKNAALATRSLRVAPTGQGVRGDIRVVASQVGVVDHKCSFAK